jgi:hypothetical protein
MAAGGDGKPIGDARHRRRLTAPATEESAYAVKGVPQDSVEYALSSILGWGHPKPEEFVDGPGTVRGARDCPWSTFYPAPIHLYP